MVKLTTLAVGYAILSLITFGLGFYVLTLAVAILQVILLILLAIKTDAVDDSLAVGYTELKNQVEELNQKIEELNRKQKLTP